MISFSGFIKKYGIVAIGVVAVIIIVLVITGKINFGKTTEKDVLVEAIDNTYALDSYEYEYDFTVRLAYLVAGVAGPYSDASYEGNVKYIHDEVDGDTFLANRNTSGLLLPDSSQQIYNIGDTIITNDYSEDGILISNPKRDIDSNYLLETDIFGNLLKDMEPDDIDTLTYYSLTNKYEINLSEDANTSLLADLTNVSNVINQSVVSDTPIDIEAVMSFTLSDDNYIQSFNYEVDFQVFNFRLIITYDQTFINYSLDTILIPEPEGYLLGEDLEDEQEYLSGLFETTLLSPDLSYEYFIDTEVDPGFLDISLGTRTIGYYYQTVISNIEYYTHRLEYDGDYEPDYIDYERYRALINDGSGEVWDEIIDHIWINDFELVETENTSTEMRNLVLIDFESLIENTQMIKKEVVEGVANYTLILNLEDIEDIIESYNLMIDYNVFVIESGFSIELGEIIISIENDEILLIDINISGMYFDDEDIKQYFDFVYEITFDYDNIYIPPISKEDIIN